MNFFVLIAIFSISLKQCLDPILVRMHLDKIYENGLNLAFEFYKLDKHSTGNRLACAQHAVVWVKQKNGRILSTNLPDEIINSILEPFNP